MATTHDIVISLRRKGMTTHEAACTVAKRKTKDEIKQPLIAEAIDMWFDIMDEEWRARYKGLNEYIRLYVKDELNEMRMNDQ